MRPVRLAAITLLAFGMDGLLALAQRAATPQPLRKQARFSRTAATVATVFTPSATAAGRALFARARDIDRQRATSQFFTMEGVDGFLGLFGRAHRNKAKPAWPACGAIHHEIGLNDRAVRREGVLQVVLRDVETKVPYEQFCTHLLFTVLD